MRVLHIAFLNYDLTEGVRTVVESIIKAQQDLGHDARLLNIIRNKKTNNFEYIYPEGLEDIISDFKPEIATFHSIYNFNYIKISKVLKANYIPYLVQLHGGGNYMAQRRKWWKKIIYNRIWGNNFISRAAGVVYLNEAEKNGDVAFKKYRKSSCVIPNGIFLPNDYDKEFHEKLRFCFLSRIDVYNKGLDLLLRGWHNYYTQLQEKAELHIYGSIASKSNGVKFKNLLTKYGTGVTYHGQVMGVEKQDAFRSCDVFILTSRFEAMPMSVLEALSYGLPCLITPETNFVNIVEENKCGWSVQLDAKQISVKLSEITVDYYKNRQQYIRNSIATSQNYTWNRIAYDSIELYKRII